MTPKTGPNDASGVVWARYASFFPRFLKTKFMYLGIQPIFHPPPHLPLPRSKRESEGPFSFCFRPPPQPCPSLAPNASRRGISLLSFTHHPTCPSLAPNASRRGLSLPVFAHHPIPAPPSLQTRVGGAQTTLSVVWAISFFFLFLFFYY
jgi:hypothetical protein